MNNLYNYCQTLNPQKALIWRIVHRNNIPWILDNGLYCGNSHVQSPNWEAIGNSELIQKRATHPVPISPFGSFRGSRFLDLSEARFQLYGQLR